MTKLPILESYWVEENRFLAGEYPGSSNYGFMRQRIDLFLEAGVNTFVDLTRANELPSYETVLKEQTQIYNVSTAYHRFAIRDHGVPSSALMTSILNTIDDAIKNVGCVYVHCWGGVGRTGMVVGCYLIRHGYTNQQAVIEVNRLYKTRPNNLYFPRSPESDEQVEFILNWWDEPNHLKIICEG